MAPIHESDQGKERWAQDEWKYYELWEKLEVKFAKKRRYWILATAIVFLILSSVPVFIENEPRWRGMAASRRLGQLLGDLKRDAATQHASFLLKFSSDGKPDYEVFKVDGCGVSTNPTQAAVRSGTLFTSKYRDEFQVLAPNEAERLGIPNVLNSICYDFLSGSFNHSSDDHTLGFALIPVKDLTESRLDRISLVLVKGKSAEISFN